MMFQKIIPHNSRYQFKSAANRFVPETFQQHLPPGIYHHKASLMIKDGVWLDSSETSICIQSCFTYLEDEPMARGALAEVAIAVLIMIWIQYKAGQTPGPQNTDTPCNKSLSYKLSLFLSNPSVSGGFTLLVFHVEDC